MKQFVLASMALSLAAFAPLGSNPCQEMRRQALRPLRDVVKFLNEHPDPETLAGAGCHYILHQLKTVPAGAGLLREIGARGADNVQSRCTTVVNSVHYSCTDVPTGNVRCVPETYSYCGQWEYSLTGEHKFELAMELSTQLETAYDKAQQLCGFALNRDETGLFEAMRDLITYDEERVAPLSDRFEGMGCGA